MSPELPSSDEAAAPEGGDSGTHTGFLTSKRLWLAGLPVLLVAFGSLLRPGTVLASGDLAFFHLPLRSLFTQAAGEGIPWWNTALHGGQPILSNPNYAAFYPPTWSALLFGAAASIQLVFLLHIAWGYAGAWRLARYLECRPSVALFAAIGFAGGGAFVSSATLLTLFCGLAWTPWILLWAGRALEPGNRTWRRDTALTGLGIAAQLLAGEPVNCILSGIAIAGLALDSLTTHGLASARRTLGRLTVALGLSLLLGAAQLLPTAGRLADSPRGGGLERVDANERSMPPVRLLEWAVPHPLGDPMRIDDELFFGQSIHDKGFPYLLSIFPGLLVAALGLGSLGRRDTRWRWAFLVMIGGGLFLALGRHNPLHGPIVGLLPIFDQLRYPEKLLLLATSALPFAAASGLEARLSAPADGTRRLDPAPLLALVVTIGLAAMVALLLVRPEAAIWLATSTRGTPVPGSAEAALITWTRNEMLTGLAVAVTGLLALGALARPSKRGRPRLELVLLALLALDLSRADWNLLPVAPIDEVTQPPAVLAGRAPEDRLFTDLMYSDDARIPLRYDDPGPLEFRNGIETLEPYIAALWGWSYGLHVDYDLMLTAPAHQALEAFSEIHDRPTLAHRFAGAWNIGTLAWHRPVRDVLADRFSGRAAPRMRLEANPELLPEIRVTPEVQFHADPAAALAAARAEGYLLADREHWVGIEGEGPRGPESGGELTEVESGWARVELEARSEGGIHLQIARTWDAGWSARIDGAQTPIHRTATGQMGVVVPPDRQRVELSYFDPLVPIGCLLSLLGLGTLVWLRRS